MAEDIEDIVEDVVEDVTKPDMVFEDEFEIITEQEYDDRTVDEPAEDDGDEKPSELAEALKGLVPQQDTNTALAEAIQDLKTSLAPKTEAPKQTDWEKLDKELADQLSEDPAAAIKTLRTQMMQEVRGGLQYLNGQNLSTQKEASQLIAKNSPEYKETFDKWGEEVTAKVGELAGRPGQSMTSVYQDAAREVKALHLDDIIAMKVQEALTKVDGGLKPSSTGVSRSPGPGAVEGQRRKRTAVLSQAQAKELQSTPSYKQDALKRKWARTNQLTFR